MMKSMKEEDTTTPVEESTHKSDVEESTDKSVLTSSGSSQAENATPMSSDPSLGKIFYMAQPEYPMLVLAFIMMIGSEATSLVVPLILANAYDTLVDEDILDDEKMVDINYYMARALIVFFGGILAGLARASILGVIGERMVARLRYQLYGAILKQEIGFFDEHKSGELVSRLGTDTTLLQSVLSQSLPESVLGVIKVIVAITLMFYISTTLAAVSLGGVVLVFMIAMPLGRLLGKLSKAYQDELGKAQTHSTEAFGSMRTVQAFAAEDKELLRFGTNIGNPDLCPWWWPLKEPSTYRVGFFKALTTAGFYTLVFGAGFGFLYVSLWYGFYLVVEGEISLGDLTAFQAYTFTIGFGLGGASTNIARVLEGIGASGRIFYLLERVPAIPKPPKDDDDDTPTPNLKPESMEGSIEFQDVTFAYPSRPDIMVLNGFSLKIAPNTTTALVGSSGAGKSTVVSLLQRFYDVDSGSITVDGNNLCDLDLQWLRRHIGYVQQEPQLFGLTVRENLLYGVDRKDVSQEEVEQACMDANAHDFICAWPNGYETLVGERGVKLSGGQKQRVAIARALLTNCRILLLDEATSALDAESEHLVQEAINKAVIGRTVIVVAHRLSTIQRANQIVVMDDHKIVDVGTHADLLGNCRKYQDLIKRQSMIIRDVSMNGLIIPEEVEEEEEK
jgi:ATP-binding cassette subfamily B protein